MDGILVALGVFVFAALVLDLSVFRLIADSHRRKVPDQAWTLAEVSRLRWGFLGGNLYIPFADIYYLIRVRPQLDAVTDASDDSDR